MVRVVADAADLYAGPGVNYLVIGRVVRDDTLEVIARTSNNDWYNVVRGQEERAWIARSAVQPLDKAAIDNVAVAATLPALPSAEPEATETREATRPPATVAPTVPPITVPPATAVPTNPPPTNPPPTNPPPTQPPPTSPPPTEPPQPPTDVPDPPTYTPEPPPTDIPEPPTYTPEPP
jgi:hypothetical protein